MPTNPRSRRERVPRRLPPRPTYTGAVPAPADDAAPPPAAPRGRGATARVQRSHRLVEREAPMVLKELRRIAAVSAVTFGLLFALAIIDRMR